MRLTKLPKYFTSVIGLVGLFLTLSADTSHADFTQEQSTVLNNANFDSRSASLADIDNDGDLDLMFQGSVGAHQLFRNNFVGSGVLTYTNITNTIPTGDLGPSWSAAWGDYDGDGLVDIFIGQSNIGGSGDVLKNNGVGGFSNESISTGLNDPGFHQNVAWADINNDGLLDLLIGMEGPSSTDEKHEIYLQGPGQSFTPVGAAVGFQQTEGIKGYGMAIGDTDGDGDLDVYISTCRGNNSIRNNFYQNMLVETGSLSFVDIADTNGTQLMTNSYGTEFHDFDDDGDLDLFVVGADQQPNKIFRNNGGNMFTDVDTITGHDLISDYAGDLNGGRPIDYDNDGDLDLFFHNHGKNGFQDNARKLYRNDGNWEFTDVTVAEGVHTLNQGAYDSTWGDLDLDGDLDLVAATDSGWFERVFLSDESTNGNHWLFIELAGTKENTTGIGASLYATIHQGTPQERTLRREANTSPGTFNQSDLPVHFGLGSATQIDELRIQWPDGTSQFIENVAVDQYLTIQSPGDFDGDGDVDDDDLIRWQTAYGSNAMTDSDLDGDSDGQDFLAWQRNYGKGISQLTAATAVPEPTSVALFLLGAIPLLARPR
ncbi:CRTAC1 family protein [Bythopirellula goksoeyrii]|uniref:FG-GAP repeat protein n=1 Tax=Bythopirellula goksoeyrii TaxID=1400387 RepID=A0A5B9QJ21_9BACT|nr:CRTAC1 family protein [Bythopirellula goksoeyrii]QEG34103.1 FG-GAP repeat protein [Bythopirellula goksoeyrii]